MFAAVYGGAILGGVMINEGEHLGCLAREAGTLQLWSASSA